MRSILLLLFVALSTSMQAQYNLEGTVTDEGSVPLEGATVVIKALKRAEASDLNGRFRFTGLPAGSYELAVSYIGYRTRSIPVNLNDHATVTIQLEESTILADEVIVSAVRAKDASPTTFTNVSKPELERKNLGQDIPFMLEHTPSVVVTSDAGAGVGYTGLRIRGTDQSRINVTINGIPLNDAESQGVFWVNLPDFVTSVDNIQIQRGVGTSTNGAGAFGGSVNMLTTSMNRQPYATLSNSAGSFKTFRHSLAFGTGLVKDRFALDGRLSYIHSDGYIDRATSDLRSMFLSAAYYDNNTVIRANMLLGKEVTYQAWYGVLESDLDSNRTFNLAGTDFFAREEPYDNEVDDYRQDHYQLLFSQSIREDLLLNVGLHYTHGRGFFEQFKVGQSFNDYNLSPIILSNDTITATDLIRQRWLDNDFYGTTFSLNYEPGTKFNATLGGAWNQYDGDHFGEIIWAQYASDGMINHRFYDNNGLKTDFNIYLKTDFRILQDLRAFVDLQYRNVGYSVDGIDIGNRVLFVDDDLNFFNPKVGLNYRIGTNASAYASFGVANKEPSRNDYIDANPGVIPEPEALRDFEAGFRWVSDKYRLTANYYFMDYTDQLVLTGQLNDVGTPIRTNVEDSYRTGIELDGVVAILRNLNLSGSVTYSINKIKNFTEVINTYDEGYTAIPSLAVTNQFENTDIAFSPSWIAHAIVSYEPIPGLTLDLLNKYVGEQFLDNTSSQDRKIDAYFINDVVIEYAFESEFIREIGLKLLLNNITNRLYESNGYTFTERYTDAEVNPSYLTDPVTYNYFYPQAGFNVMAGLTIGF